jgi:signal peptidase I
MTGAAMRLLQSGKLGSFWRFVREPLAVAAVMIFSTSAIAAPFYVPSGSMEPTLAIGDAIVASKFDYGYSRFSLPYALGPQSDTRLMEKLPARGDVVVFNLPRDPKVVYVKRVIGLPGDHVQMRAGHLFINGRDVALKPAGRGEVEMEDGSPMAATRYLETLPGGVTHPIYKLDRQGPLDNTPEFVVPAGHLFMMGDNRDNSLDSRVPAEQGGVGFVPMENLVGKAQIVMGSYDYRNARQIWTWPAEFRLARFFSRIR